MIRKTAIIATTFLLASLVFVGCDGIGELPFNMPFKSSETGPVLIGGSESAAQESAQPSGDMGIEAQETPQTAAPEQQTVQNDDAAAPGTQVDGAVVESQTEKGTVVQYSMIVFGTPEYDGGVLLFYATLASDNAVEAKVTVLDEQQRLQLAEGDTVSVVGVLAEPCSATGKNGNEVQMVMIYATDVTVTAPAQENVLAQEPSAEDAAPAHSLSPEPTPTLTPQES